MTQGTRHSLVSGSFPVSRRGQHWSVNGVSVCVCVCVFEWCVCVCVHVHAHMRAFFLKKRESFLSPKRFHLCSSWHEVALLEEAL